MWRLLKLVGDPNEIDVLLEKSSKQRKTLKIYPGKDPYSRKQRTLLSFVLHYYIVTCITFQITCQVKISQENAEASRRFFPHRISHRAHRKKVVEL